MKNTTRIAFAALALVAAGLTACNNNKTETTTSTASTATMEAKAVNTTCPFSGEAAKADITSTCDGKTVAFCCAGCKGKFDKMDKAHQEAMMAKAK